MKNFIAAAAILMFCAGTVSAQTSPPDPNMNSQNNGQKTAHPTQTKTEVRCSTERAKNSRSCGVRGKITLIKHAKHKRKMRPGVENNTEINKTP